MEAVAARARLWVIWTLIFRRRAREREALFDFHPPQRNTLSPGTLSPTSHHHRHLRVRPHTTRDRDERLIDDICCSFAIPHFHLFLKPFFFPHHLTTTTSSKTPFFVTVGPTQYCPRFY